MSRASRRSRREDAKRANNAVKVTRCSNNKQHCTSESKEQRMHRMQELYKQNRRLGEES